MIKGIFCQFKNILGELIYNIKNRLWVAISFIAAFIAGVIFSLCFKESAVGGFFDFFARLCFDVGFTGSFWGALWRFALSALILTAIFLLLSQNKLLLIIAYLIIFIRGFAFISAIQSICCAISFLEILLIIPLILLQQALLILQFAMITTYYYTNNISFKCVKGGYPAYFLVQALLFALLQSVISSLLIKTILWLV